MFFISYFIFVHSIRIDDKFIYHKLITVAFYSFIFFWFFGFLVFFLFILLELMLSFAVFYFFFFFILFFVLMLLREVVKLNWNGNERLHLLIMNKFNSFLFNS